MDVEENDDTTCWCVDIYQGTAAAYEAKTYDDLDDIYWRKNPLDRACG